MPVLATPSRTTDAVYNLTLSNGLPTACTCPGFTYRNRCRHITEHTLGGSQVYCDGCGTTHLRAVRYDAGRAWVRRQGDTCAQCSRKDSLCVVPDWDAREALRSREEALAVPSAETR
ncbi:SWIM zinc finger family protein [Nocardioides euryhalodurans]|uniref:SWIM zinc finger family protein n=1 Tax=Nocardioides euryhalodurans TaxID=2518370 RepID=UPI0026878F8F